MLETLLAQGIVPVLHGDVLLDSAQRCCIFSGDKIMLWVSKNLRGGCKPHLVVFLTDVAGIFDKPPSQKDACLIREIFVESDGSVFLQN
jgi:isopentenyl phosphate kinase